jgi:hypothetical protein
MDKTNMHKQGHRPGSQTGWRGAAYYDVSAEAQISCRSWRLQSQCLQTKHGECDWRNFHVTITYLGNKYAEAPSKLDANDRMHQPPLRLGKMLHGCKICIDLNGVDQ